MIQIKINILSNFRYINHSIIGGVLYHQLRIINRFIKITLHYHRLKIINQLKYIYNIVHYLENEIFGYINDDKIRVIFYIE